MIFNSIQFLVFFPLVTILYYLLPHRFRWIHLFIASCVFYMAFIPVYILILFFTIIIDYMAGIMIEKETGRRRKAFLILSVVVNVGVLAFFKYYNFFTENVNELLHLFHITTYAVPYLNIILPIGLSFHTFQAMSYTIEVYRGNQKAERHFGIYALYVMFYPQLVAGPIERPQNLLHQFKEEHKFNSQNLMDGLRLMLWGLFKKMVIADRLALYVSVIYNNPGHFHYLNLLTAVVFFSIQVYCDFSGYSDIAIGSAKSMGFDLMVNFNRPFLYSTNFTAFFRRWHISLNTWFVDYLYTPLAVSFRNYGTLGIAFSIMITFLLSGLWHGASWTFVVYGFLMGIVLVFEVYTKKIRKKVSKAMPIFIYEKSSILLTFMVMSLIWVFFRAGNVSTALLILKSIVYHDPEKHFSWILSSTVNKASFLLSIVFISIMLVIERFTSNDLSEFKKYRFLDIGFWSVILTLIITFGVFNNNSFIYFQF